MTNVTAAVECRVGIEHVGITVPDVPAATRFFEHAFGAEVVFDSITPEVLERPEVKEALEQVDLGEGLGVPPGAKIRWIRIIAIGDGPMIELFEFEVDGQRPPVVPSDLGLTHFCIYVDDVHAAAARVEEAGGTLLAGPVQLFGLQAGEGNIGRYAKTPWGSAIELMSYPSKMPFEDLTSRLPPGRRG